MKVSRHFLFIVAILLIITGGAYYFFTKSSPFEKVSAENLSLLDSYLFKNYSFTLALDKKTEESIRITCDQGETDQALAENATIDYPCQNENPAHKIVIGWAKSSEKYMSIMESLANEQLFWKNHPAILTSSADVVCKERVDYPFYRNVLFGMDCTTRVDEGEILYSSIFFLQPKGVTDKKVFIAVLNTSKVTSAQEVENELLALLAKQKISSKTISLKEFFASTPSFSNNGAGVASSTSQDSIEAELLSPSNSSNTITKNTGSGIDATVCNVVDATQCYPLYCESVTAVWNYSLNKCVEPSFSPSAANNISNNCPEETPVWDGSKCRKLTGDIISDNTCTIPVGRDSCEMEVFWSTHTSKGAVEVRLPLTETLVLGTGPSGKIKHTFLYQATPYAVELYDITGKLNAGKFTTTCVSGGWDLVTKKCVDPQVAKVEIMGEYYASPGTMTVACNNSDRYFVRNTDTSSIVASSSYTEPVSAPLAVTGNYAAVCAQGEYESVPMVRYYNAPPPPPPSLSLLISPRTLIKDEKTLINWHIQYPIDSCKLRIIVVCDKGKECTPSQVEFENAINQVLETESTDENDKNTRRPIAEAVRMVAPDHINKDWVAAGQKTLTFSESADVILSCGKIQEKKRVYIRTTKQTTGEQ